MSNYRIVLLVFWGIIGPLFSFSQSDSILNAEHIFNQIQLSYANNWYCNLTFKQETFRYRYDSIVNREEWEVAYSAPSKLHIRYKDFNSGRGWIIANDSIYTFNKKQLIGRRDRIHEAMILGHDLYCIPPQVALTRTKQLGINTSFIEITPINGKRVIQIGDPNVFCFWLFADNLLFYGYRKRTDTGSIRELYFENYRTIQGWPVATELHYYDNGRLYQLERYSEIRLPSYLHPNLFSPMHFNDIRW